MKRPRSKTSNEHKDHFAHFKHAAYKHFNFLVLDYGFEHISTKVHMPECSIKYHNSTTGVTIHYELESAAWVELSRLVREANETVESETYGLHLLAREYCPQMITEQEGGVEKMSAGYLDKILLERANILKTCGSDVLKGNFKIFQHLRSIAEAERRRINLELFGSETGETI